MKAHTHISAVHGIAVLLLVIAVFGTIHLWAMTHPHNRYAQAMTSGLGF